MFCLLRTPLFSESSQDLVLNKLAHLLRHPMCFIASLIFFGCKFNNSSMSRLASFLASEPYYEAIENLPEKTESVKKEKNDLDPPGNQDDDDVPPPTPCSKGIKVLF